MTIHEFDLYGILVPAALAWFVTALAITDLLRRRLSACEFYRFVWHPALFDAAIFVVVLGGLVALNDGIGR